MNINNLNYQPPMTYNEPNKEQESRTMTKQEAIELLGEQKYFLTKNVYKSTNETDREWKLTKALNMAIEALEHEPKEDCISRELVLDKIRFYAETTTSIEKSNGAKNCAELVELAPSVVPKGSDTE